jgi:hypothetical protein
LLPSPCTWGRPASRALTRRQHHAAPYLKLWPTVLKIARLPPAGHVADGSASAAFIDRLGMHTTSGYKSSVCTQRRHLQRTES